MAFEANWTFSTKIPESTHNGQPVINILESSHNWPFTIEILRTAHKLTVHHKDA